MTWRWPPAALSIAAISAIAACTIAQSVAFATGEAVPAPDSNPQIWTCAYIAVTPQGPLAITAKFEVFGNELAEIETIPRNLSASQRYKILENTDDDLVAAISIKNIDVTPPPAIGAVVIVIAKQNGLFQQSGVILGVRVGAPTLGHCENH